MVTPVAIPMVNALVAKLTEEKKSEEPILSSFDSKMPVTREYVNAVDPQLNYSNNQMIQMGDFNTTDLLKDSNKIKLVPVEKTPSTTPARNEVSVNSVNAQVMKPEEEISKMESVINFHLDKGNNVTEPVPNEKPTSLHGKVMEANVDVESIQTSNEGEMPKVKDIHPVQLQDTSDMSKAILSEKSSSVKHNSKPSFDTKKLFGIPSSGPSNLFQTAPKMFLAESSSISSSSSSILTKTVSQGDSFHTVESISTRANESGSAFANRTKLNNQTVSSKADLTGFSNKDVAGKVSSETKMGNMPKPGFGTVPFGSKQSSGRLFSPSITTSNPPASVSASSSVAQLFEGVKDSHQGKTGFCSTNAAATIASSSILQSGMKTSIHSTLPSESSSRTMVQSQQGPESLVPSGTYKADSKSIGRASGMSEIEADFSRELEKVRVSLSKHFKIWGLY